MNWTQIVGLVAGILTASSLLPQLIKTLRVKKAEDVSIGMLFILMLGLITWIIYGILRDDLPIIATNSFSLALNITMIFLRLKYKRSGGTLSAQRVAASALKESKEAGKKHG